MIEIGMYFVAVVCANLIAVLGPWFSIGSALLLIGATITLRDAIHERWIGHYLPLRMGILIASAGLVSAWLNRGAVRIAVASCLAFMVSETLDAVVYHRLRDKRWVVKVNGSNSLSALADSIIFPTVAFGSFMPVIVALQYVAKVAGGFVWGVLLRPKVAALLVLALMAAPAHAQIISANAVWLHNSGVSAPAGELFIAAPPIYGLRPYVIASWNTDGDERPTILARVGYSKNFGRWMAGVGAGVISPPFDRTLRPTVSIVGMGPGGRVRPYAVVAYEQAPSWGWTFIGGLNIGIYFRK